MSSELAVYKKSKVVDFNVNKFQSDAVEWSERMGSGNELFNPVLSAESKEVVLKASDSKSKAMGFGMAGLVAGSVPMCVSPQILESVGFDLSLSGGLLVVVLSGVFIVPGITWLSTYSIANMIGKRKPKYIQANEILDKAFEIDTQTLGLWLRNRYELFDIDPSVLEKMTEAIYMWQSFEFQDEAKPGRKWSLAYDEPQKGWFVEEVKTALHKEAGVAVVNQTSTTESDVEELSGECALLLEGFQSRQKKLQKFDLTVDAKHVLLRCSEDVRQAVSMYHKLAMGDQDLASTRLVEALSLLNEEMSELLAHELSALDEEFKIQNSYLKSRQLLSETSTLALPLSAVKSVEKKVDENVI